MNTHTLTRIRISLGWLVIAAFVVRSLIPVGYMPDFAGGGSGPTITICGGKSKTPDAPTTHRNDAPCPFSVNAVFAFDGLGGTGFALALYLFIAFLTLTALMLAPQRRLGNVSSRGPPPVF